MKRVKSGIFPALLWISDSLNFTVRKLSLKPFLAPESVLGGLVLVFFFSSTAAFLLSMAELVFFLLLLCFVSSAAALFFPETSTGCFLEPDGSF